MNKTNEQTVLTDDELRAAYGDATGGSFVSEDMLAFGRMVASRARLLPAASEAAPTIRNPLMVASDAGPIAPDDKAIFEAWVSASDVDGIAYDGPSFERGYRAGEIAERDRASEAGAVAYRLSRKTAFGSWKIVGDGWCDGKPSAELLAEVRALPEQFRLEHAYAAPPAPVEAGAVPVAEIRHRAGHPYAAMRKGYDANGDTLKEGTLLYAGPPALVEAGADEPTPTMIEAGAKAAREYYERTGGNDPAVIYRAMRAAAPSDAPAQQDIKVGAEYVRTENDQQYRVEVTRVSDERVDFDGDVEGWATPNEFMRVYRLAPAAQDFRDAYLGAREDLEIWKRRALEAEALNRKFIASVNGPTFMGEPAPAGPRYR